MEDKNSVKNWGMEKSKKGLEKWWKKQNKKNGRKERI